MDRARTLIRLGRYPAALEQLESTVSRWPDRAAPRESLARLLATCPDDAVRNPGQALAISSELSQRAGNGDPRLLDVVAASQAASGDFGNAVQTGEQAIRIVEESLATPGSLNARESAQARGFLAEVRGRVELYRRGQPYVQR